MAYATLAFPGKGGGGSEPNKRSRTHREKAHDYRSKCEVRPFVRRWRPRRHEASTRKPKNVEQHCQQRTLNLHLIDCWTRHHFIAHWIMYNNHESTSRDVPQDTRTGQRQLLQVKPTGAAHRAPNTDEWLSWAQAEPKPDWALSGHQTTCTTCAVCVHSNARWCRWGEQCGAAPACFFPPSASLAQLMYVYSCCCCYCCCWGFDCYVHAIEKPPHIMHTNVYN